MTKHKNNIGLIQIVAALLIVNHHTSILGIPHLSHFTKGGFVVNTIFVYLSGFLLAKSYNNASNNNYFTFLKKRFLRIYPSLHVSLLFIMIIYLAIGIEFSFDNFLLTLTGFQYFFGVTSLGVQLWFISIILLCYILCIPTIFLIKNDYNIFFMCLFFILFIFFTINGIDIDVYENINTNYLYRFIFHYIIFSIGIYFFIFKKDIEILNLDVALITFLIAALIRIYAEYISYPGLIKTISNVCMAFSLITLLSVSFNFFAIRIPSIFKLSLITYEIYIIHVSVIFLFHYMAPGKFYTYPLVFIISIALAFIISSLSARYEKFISQGIVKLNKLFSCD